MFAENTHHLSEEKINSKRQFQRLVNKARYEKENWVKDPLQMICKYLYEVHHVHVPADFAEQIEDAHNQFHASQKYVDLPLRVIDSIVASCEMWKEFLADSEESFFQLVCTEILSMVRIQTSVIAGRNFSEKYNVSLKQQPPFLFTTIVTESGALKVYS